jgi:hypothetical protein
MAGGYQVESTAGNMLVAVFKNGTYWKFMGRGEPSVGFAYGSCLVYLNGSSDFVGLYALQNQATQNATANPVVTWFQGSLVRSG